jgi:hypothetical protein
VSNVQRSEGIRIPLDIMPGLLPDLELYAPDFERTDIDRDEPSPVLVLYPRARGPQTLEVVAFIPSTNTIARQTELITL